MTEAISLPVWHLVIYLLGGVALGAVISMLVLVFSGDRSPTRLKQDTLAQPVSSNPSPTAALNQAVAQKRTLTVDKAASVLNVTPRRVRRWLDEGALTAVPMTNGARRVTALSVHDLLARIAAGKTEVGEDESPLGQEPQAKPESEGVYPALIPGQFYWYHVKGHKRPYNTMKEALRAANVPLSEKMYPSWVTVPEDIRTLIRRERIT